MWFAGAGMVVNVLGALALAPFLAHVGIALATSLAGWVNTGLLTATLWRRGHFRLDDGAKKRLPLLLVASILMGVVLYGGAMLLSDLLAAPALAVRFAALIVLVAVGMTAFALFVQLTGAVDLKGYMVRGLRRKPPTVT